MSKELPYFRFTPQEWQNGKISLENLELKGLFVDICSYYWVNNCSITQAMLKKRFSTYIFQLNELIELQIFYVDKNSDFISIPFLNEQFDALSELRKSRQNAGSKGGKQRSSNAKAMLKQNSSYKDNNKDNNKEYIYRKFAHLSITNEEVEKLKENYTIEQIDDVIDKIENYAKNKNYKSLYLTAINWLKKEQNTKKENKVIIELRKLIPECKTKRELEKLTYFADIILESNELKNKFFDCGLQTLLDVFELAGAFIANWELDFKEQILKYDNKDSSKSISTIINKIKNRYV